MPIVHKVRPPASKRDQIMVLRTAVRDVLMQIERREMSLRDLREFVQPSPDHADALRWHENTYPGLTDRMVGNVASFLRRHTNA